MVLPQPVVIRPDPLSAAGPDRRKSARRWRLTGVIAAIAVIAAAGGLALALSRPRPHASGPAGQPAAGGSRALAAEAAARSQAVSWVTSQVSRTSIVACDRVMCAALAAHGFPAADLNVLGPTAPDPFGADLLIATADLASQFGSKLAAVYAPEVIAGFGSGSARIDVRVIAPDGAAAYRVALQTDLLARKAYGAALLHNHGITISAAAQHELIAGLVDARLLSAIAFLTHQRPVDVLEFGSIAPGAAPGVPLRFADLAESDPAARLGGPGYLRSLVTVLRSGIPLYRPASMATVRLAGGQVVLRIEFAAPSPLGLLSSGGSGGSGG